MERGGKYGLWRWQGLLLLGAVYSLPGSPGWVLAELEQAKPHQAPFLRSWAANGWKELRSPLHQLGGPREWTWAQGRLPTCHLDPSRAHVVEVGLSGLLWCPDWANGGICALFQEA